MNKKQHARCGNGAGGSPQSHGPQAGLIGPPFGCGSAPPCSPETPPVPAALSPCCPPAVPGQQSLWICSTPPDPSRLYTATRGSCQHRWCFIWGRTEGQTGPNTNTETPNSVGTVTAPRILPSSHPRVKQGIPVGFSPLLTSLFCGLSGRLMPFILW